MRVVHVTTSTNLGGAQVMLQRYLEALGPEAKQNVVVSLLPNGPIADPIAATGATVISLELRQGRISLRALRELRRHVRASKPDVVQGWMYHGALAAWAGVVGLRRRNGPVLSWSIHHSMQDMAREKRSTRILLRVMSVLSRQVDLMIYCATVSKTQHEALGFAASRSVVFPNAIDTQVFRADPKARARLGEMCGIPDGRLIVGNAARAHPMKDHGAMVKAVGRLRDQGHDVQAVILGEGHENGAAVQAAEALGIRDRVSILGARSNMAELVPGFDVFLLSSAWGEAFPLAVAEAMAAEVPCVVTDVGDCAFLVGETGVVVPPSDPEAQARAVAGLIAAGPAERAELGRRARQRVTEICETQHYVAMHEAVFSEVLDMRRSGKRIRERLARSEEN